jgi:hypothetical protein
MFGYESSIYMPKPGSKDHYKVGEFAAGQRSCLLCTAASNPMRQLEDTHLFFRRRLYKVSQVV